MTRRVLVTGASGFIGRQAVPALVANGWEVHAAARRPIELPGAAAHAVDLMDAEAVAALLVAVRPSHLLHLAWDVTPGRYWSGRENLDWVAASLRLYRAFVAAGGERVVAAGTCAEYDWTSDPLEETAPLRPATLYGKAKAAVSELLAASAPADGIGLAWARLFFLYGPHEHRSRLVPSVIVPLLQGEPALIGEGLAQRDFMHVADVAAALVTVLESEHVGPVNIARGGIVPIREVARAIAEQIGRPELLRIGARPTPIEPGRLGASGAVLAGLGFRPRFSHKAGIADTIGWWRRALTGAIRER